MRTPRDMTKYLFDAGLDLWQANEQGHNALHKAAYGGHLELCRWLLNVPSESSDDAMPVKQRNEIAAARASLCDKRGQSPACLAAKAGFDEISEELAAVASNATAN